MLTMTFFDAMTVSRECARPKADDAAAERELASWYRGYAHLFAASTRGRAEARRPVYAFCG